MKQSKCLNVPSVILTPLGSSSNFVFRTRASDDAFIITVIPTKQLHELFLIKDKQT